MGEDYKNLNINAQALESNAGRFKINRKLSKAIATLMAVFSVLSFAGCTNTSTPEIPSTTAVGQFDPIEIDVNEVDLSGLVVALQKGEGYPQDSFNEVCESLTMHNINYMVADGYDEMEANLKTLDSTNKEILAIRLGGEYNKTGQTVVMLDYYSGNNLSDALALSFEESYSMGDAYVDVKHGAKDTYGTSRSSTRFERMIKRMKEDGELTGVVRPLSIIPSLEETEKGDEYYSTFYIEKFLAPAIVRYACLEETQKNTIFYKGKEGVARKVEDTPPVLKAEVVGTASPKAIG